MNLSDDNQTFIAWTKTRIHSLKARVFLAVTALSAGFNLFIALNLGTVDRSAHMIILYGTQATLILIICAIIAFGQKPQKFTDLYQRGTETLKQFWRWWPPLWFAWLILYAGLTIKACFFYSDESAGNSPRLENFEPGIVFGLHQLNNVATLILLMLFHLLGRPSLPRKGYPNKGDIFLDEQNHIDESETTQERLEGGESKFWFWVALFFVSAMFELALISVNENTKAVLTVFGIGYGIIGATATALVVGKLDDHLLGVPTFIIVFLFIYAGIQPSFDFLITFSGNFPETESEQLLLLATREVIVVIALVSKIVLFVTIQWLSMTNRLLYYLVQSYSLYSGVNTNRQKFLRGLNETASKQPHDAAPAPHTPPA
ncbi:MAG TPA: hypothetical protein VF703_11620 [Pyrinomonadaceae bacterium]